MRFEDPSDMTPPLGHLAWAVFLGISGLPAACAIVALYRSKIEKVDTALSLGALVIALGTLASFLIYLFFK
jgi:hypothetical protein